jgi:uncharacterized protein YcnI
MRNGSLFLAAAALFLAPASAHAHIVLAEPSAPPGADHVSSFKVGHGCDGSPTLAVRIAFPETVIVTDVPEMPGWNIATETADGRIVAASWTGHLEPTEAAEFSVAMTLPSETGLLYFPAVQSCETGENQWIEIPPEGAAWNSVPHPAPVLEVTATPLPADPHAHH